MRPLHDAEIDDFRGRPGLVAVAALMRGCEVAIEVAERIAGCEVDGDPDVMALPQIADIGERQALVAMVVPWTKLLIDAGAMASRSRSSSSAAMTARPGSSRVVGSFRMCVPSAVTQTTSVNVPAISMPMLTDPVDEDVFPVTPIPLLVLAQV